MKSTNKQINLLFFLASYIYLFVLMIFSVQPPAMASDSTLPYSKNTQYARFDQAYTKFSQNILEQQARQRHYRLSTNITAIAYRAKQFYAKHRYLDAIAFVLANRATINNNLNSKGAIEIEKILLEANEYNTAEQLLAKIRNQADPLVVSNVLFAFANYYYARNNWQKTIDLVEQTVNDLPPKDLQRAMLIKGVSLQNLKHHRKALKAYAKIPRNSAFYSTARINMAVANIRQDWWSDGYSILNGLLNTDSIDNNKDLKDRLNTMIGYTFLQQAYYRNSRDAFRKVSLKGRYTKRALLGIALDAAYQKDYVGALNAARILRNSTGNALQIDEANLLVPYFYEKLGQMSTASAGYTDAIKYFESRLQNLKQAVAKDTTFYQHAPIDNDRRILLINSETVDLGSELPNAFFVQNNLLHSYRNSITRLENPSISQDYGRLRYQMAVLVRDTARSLLNKKISYLTDYMNQCRYGLARLYDKNADK